MELKELNGYKIVFYTKEGFMRNCKFTNNFNSVEYSGLVSDISEKLSKKIVHSYYGNIDTCYYKNYQEELCAFSTAKQSFRTLSKLEWCIITKQ